MKWLIAATGFIGGGLIGLLVFVAVANGQQLQTQHQLQAQIGQLRSSAQRVQVRLEGELAAERAAFAQAEARIGGTHRDLITCADWQVMFLPVSGTDSFGGQLAASAGPPPLPQHCVNQ